MRCCFAIVLATLACDAPPAVVPAPDYDAFERDVYPLLLQDCGFAQCHGDLDRFFHVLGPGRLRWNAEDDPFDPARDEEVWISYQRTRSMLVASPDGGEPLLLRKVLPGGGHQGVDAHGGSVYPDRDDPRWQLLADWAHGDLEYGP